MWAKLDDALLDHPKVMAAGRAFGKDGLAKALGFYAFGLLHTQKHLTDGFLSDAVVEGSRYVERPVDAAAVMVQVKFWERVDGGYIVHDFHDHNPHARDVLAKRQADRDRKRKGGRNSHGNGDDSR